VQGRALAEAEQGQQFAAAASKAANARVASVEAAHVKGLTELRVGLKTAHEVRVSGICVLWWFDLV